MCALAGAAVASAVLVPVGWSQVRTERQRAEAAEAERERAEKEVRDALEAANRALNAEQEARDKALADALLGPLQKR